MGPRAFSLVEILIVLFLVLILALIAIPSFWEAKEISSLSVARARMEAMEQALVLHQTDWGSVPADFNDPFSLVNQYRVRNGECSQVPGLSPPGNGGLTFLVDRTSHYAVNIHCPLTTPAAYITPPETIDPFSDGTVPFGYDSRVAGADTIQYGGFFSAGPDKVAGDWLRGSGTGGYVLNGLAYSPTNGVHSRGEFWGTVSTCTAEPPNCFVDQDFRPRKVYPAWDTDINEDGITDNNDLFLLLADWRKVSGP